MHLRHRCLLRLTGRCPRTAVFPSKIRCSPLQAGGVRALASQGGTVEFVSDVSRTMEIAAQLSAGPVALDCEGVCLGRFGRLCLLQLGTADRRFFVFDALIKGHVEALSPLLQSKSVVKVMHDCREDSAALYHQHGVTLQGVFDTQAVYAVLERKAGNPPYQVSCAELLEKKLSMTEPNEVFKVKHAMRHDDRIWAKRPLEGPLVRYALHGVLNLIDLYKALLSEAKALDERSGRHHWSVVDEAFKASAHAAEYRHLNSEFETAESMAKIGTLLWGFLATRTDRVLLFKLNAGRVGLVSTPSAVSRFDDVQIGDCVLCCVSGVNIDGKYLYLDRYDHDWDFYDHQMRPSSEPEVGTGGKEHRHRTGILHDTLESLPPSDPLLLRGLPAETFGPDLDAWEADPEDMGLPADIEETAPRRHR